MKDNKNVSIFPFSYNSYFSMRETSTLQTQSELLSTLMSLDSLKSVQSINLESLSIPDYSLNVKSEDDANYSIENNSLNLQ